MSPDLLLDPVPPPGALTPSASWDTMIGQGIQPGISAPGYAGSPTARIPRPRPAEAAAAAARQRHRQIINMLGPGNLLNVTGNQYRSAMGGMGGGGFGRMGGLLSLLSGMGGFGGFRDPLSLLAQGIQLGHGQVDVNLQLDKSLIAARAIARAAPAFNIGINIDRIGSTPIARPGDPTFTGLPHRR